MPSFAVAVPLIQARFAAARVVAAGQAWADMPWTFDNGQQDFAQQQMGPWGLLEISPAGSSMSQFGSPGKRMKQDDGIIALHVFVPAGTGTALAWPAAEAAGNVFRMVKFDGVACEAPSQGNGGPGDSDGRWFRVSVTVPFATHYTA